MKKIITPLLVIVCILAIGINVYLYQQIQGITNDNKTVNSEIAVLKEDIGSKDTQISENDSTLGTYLAMENMINTHAYNIGSSEEISIEDLFSKCIEVCEYLTGAEYTGYIYYDLVREGDPKKRWLDTTRAKEELGFECQVSLNEGIIRTAKRIIEEMERGE